MRQKPATVVAYGLGAVSGVIETAHPKCLVGPGKSCAVLAECTDFRTRQAVALIRHLRSHGSGGQGRDGFGGTVVERRHQDPHKKHGGDHGYSARKQARLRLPTMLHRRGGLLEEDASGALEMSASASDRGGFDKIRWLEESDVCLAPF